MDQSSRSAIFSALGELAVNWNTAEGWIRTLLGSYVERTVIGEALTLELGSVGIQNALNSVAAHAALDGEAEYLEHCTKLYERLRGYRNYYIHGTIFAVEYTDGTAPAGFTFTKSAKGRIKTASARFEANHIMEIANACDQLKLYAQQIFHHLHGDQNNGGARPPWPDKPPLPPELDKNAPYPQLPNIRPLASEK